MPINENHFLILKKSCVDVLMCRLSIFNQKTKHTTKKKLFHSQNLFIFCRLKHATHCILHTVHCTHSTHTFTQFALMWPTIPSNTYMYRISNSIIRYHVVSFSVVCYFLLLLLIFICFCCLPRAVVAIFCTHSTHAHPFWSFDLAPIETIVMLDTD